jgi:hypothetical protein
MLSVFCTHVTVLIYIFFSFVAAHFSFFLFKASKGKEKESTSEATVQECKVGENIHFTVILMLLLISI